MSRAAATATATGCYVTTAKVLVVGAGGIGCELIKNLVLMGFTDVMMIDLDTIDYSNLNRQFLFRQQHVGQPKCTAARDAALSMPHDPNLTITAKQANIKAEQFDRAFWRSFDIVLSALDNVAARIHVNHECLVANVPLIESGTQGAEGQAHAIFKGRTSCYSCQLPPPPTTYPVCTIRNHPDLPVHCIHWVKDLLFKKLFGGDGGDGDDLIDSEEGAREEAEAEPDAAGGHQAEGDSKLGHQAEGEGEAPAAAPVAAAPVKPTPLVRNEGEPAADFARRVYQTVFEDDIERLLRMDVLWKERTPPTPLRLRTNESGGLEVQAGDAAAAAVADAATLRGAQDSPEVAPWTVAQSTAVFLHAVTSVLQRRSAEVGSMSFDKDDADAMDFVTAAANLRMACFGIAQQSRWDVKEIAGNIIPAIATTNAIISGFIVLEALKVLANKRNECRFCWCSKDLRGKKRDLRLMGTHLEPPSPFCGVCSWPSLTLCCDTSAFSFGQLKAAVLSKELGVLKPTVDMIVIVGDSETAKQFRLCDGLTDPEDFEDEEEKAAYAKYESYLPLALDALPFPCLDGAELIIDNEADDAGSSVVYTRKVNGEDEDVRLETFSPQSSLSNFKIYIRHTKLEDLEADSAADGFMIIESNLKEAMAKRKAATEAKAAEKKAAAVSAAKAEIDDDDDEVELVTEAEVALGAPSSAALMGIGASKKRKAEDEGAGSSKRHAESTVETVDDDDDDCVILD